MENKTLFAAALLMTAAFVVPASAYHISGDFASAPLPGETDSYGWTVGAGNNTVVFCEGDGNVTEDTNRGGNGASDGDGFSGINGLCNMAYNGASRSDGTYPNGDEANSTTTLNRTHVDAIDADEWLLFDMCQYAATAGGLPTDVNDNACDFNVDWTASYDFAGCDVAAGEVFAIRHVFLAWADTSASGGHLSGFVDGVNFTDNVLAGASLGGSYTVSETATTYHNDDPVGSLYCPDNAAYHPVGLAVFECSDGKDNDGDTFIDAADLDCRAGGTPAGQYQPFDNNEAA